MAGNCGRQAGRSFFSGSSGAKLLFVAADAPLGVHICLWRSSWLDFRAFCQIKKSEAFLLHAGVRVKRGSGGEAKMGVMEKHNQRMYDFTLCPLSLSILSERTEGERAVIRIGDSRSVGYYQSAEGRCKISGAPSRKQKLTIYLYHALEIKPQAGTPETNDLPAHLAAISPYTTWYVPSTKPCIFNVPSSSAWSGEARTSTVGRTLAPRRPETGSGPRAPSAELRSRFRRRGVWRFRRETALRRTETSGRNWKWTASRSCRRQSGRRPLPKGILKGRKSLCHIYCARYLNRYPIPRIEANFYGMDSDSAEPSSPTVHSLLQTDSLAAISV